MPKKKSDPAMVQQPEKKEAENKKYPTEKLLRSRHLEGYQRDFAKAILTKPSYSIAEAKEALDRTLKGKYRLEK